MNNNIRILLVDDSINSLQLLSQILKKDYAIKAAKNGRFALEIIKNDKPDMILLDIKMPEMDGYEVCKILKSDKNTKDIPIIFITSLLP